MISSAKSSRLNFSLNIFTNIVKISALYLTRLLISSSIMSRRCLFVSLQASSLTLSKTLSKMICFENSSLAKSIALIFDSTILEVHLTRAVVAALQSIKVVLPEPGNQKCC